VQTVEDTKRDHERIGSPDKWPYWPILPMKRFKNGDLEIGVITPDYPSTVIHLGMFQVDMIKLVLHQLANDGEVMDVKTTAYQDVWAMLDDGWRVD
jgi:hypothetical protein